MTALAIIALATIHAWPMLLPVVVGAVWCGVAERRAES